MRTCLKESLKTIFLQQEKRKMMEYKLSLPEIERVHV